VLRYQEGQTYSAHYDSSYDKDEFGPKFRLATLLIYLSGENVCKTRGRHSYYLMSARLEDVPLIT
jgi:hypothetical protein